MIVRKRLPLKIWVAAFFRNQQWFYLRIVGARGSIAAVACPICMEELASGAVEPLVGVGSEIVALRLQKVCGQAVGGVAVKIAERCRHRGRRNAVLHGCRCDLAPRRNELLHGFLEIRVEQEVAELRIVIIRFFDLAEED